VSFVLNWSSQWNAQAVHALTSLFWFTICIKPTPRRTEDRMMEAATCGKYFGLDATVAKLAIFAFIEVWAELIAFTVFVTGSDMVCIERDFCVLLRPLLVVESFAVRCFASLCWCGAKLGTSKTVTMTLYRFKYVLVPTMGSIRSTLLIRKGIRVVLPSAIERVK